MDDKGRAVLRRINGKVKDFDVDAEYAVIRNTIMAEFSSGEIEKQTWRHVVLSYLDCFRRKNARRTLGATLPICTQQLTGLAFLNIYASLFFRQSGFDDPFLITTILSKFARFRHSLNLLG